MEITTKKYYTCSVCGRTSISEGKIKECEASHIGIDPNKPIEMSFGRNRRVPYPESIKVIMEDGGIGIYAFVRAEKEEP